VATDELHLIRDSVKVNHILMAATAIMIVLVAARKVYLLFVLKGQQMKI